MERYIGEEELIQVKGVIDSQKLWKLHGTYVRKFEKAFGERMGAAHVIAVNSGSSALEAAVAACDINPGDEVICTAYTFIASSMCVLRHNGIPVFADVDPRTLCLDPVDIEKKITNRTKAIIVVHIYGQPAEMDAIMKIARQHNLRVIEDCCQADDSMYKGKKVGTIGDIGVFSLQQGKHMTSGEGGIVVTNNFELFKKAAMYSNIGMIWDWQPPETFLHFAIGGNYRLGELQGAVALAQLGKIDMFNKERKEFVKIIENGLGAAKGISLAYRYEGAEPNFYFYPLRYDEGVVGIPKNEFIKKCHAEIGNPKHEIDSGTIKINYLEPVYRNINKLTFFREICEMHSVKIEYKAGLCPVLESTVPDKFITIRMHHGRSREDIATAVNAIKKTLEKL